MSPVAALGGRNWMPRVYWGSCYALIMRVALTPPALVAMLAAGACYRATPPPQQPATRTAPAVKSYARTIADPLGFLPADSDVVGSVDVAQLRASPSWARVEPMLFAEEEEGLANIRASCGFDLVTAINRVSFGARVAGTDQWSAVFVVHGLDRELTLACLRKLDTTTVVTGPSTFRGTADEGEVIHGEFVARSALVLYWGAQTPEMLQDVLDSGAPLRSSPESLDLLANVQLRDTAWFVMRRADAFGDLARLGSKPTAVMASVRVVDGLTATLRSRLATPESAAQLQALAQPQLQVLSGFADKLEVVAEDADVVLRVEMTQAQLDMAASMLAAAFGRP